MSFRKHVLFGLVALGLLPLFTPVASAQFSTLAWTYAGDTKGTGTLTATTMTLTSPDGGCGQPMPGVAYYATTIPLTGTVHVHLKFDNQDIEPWHLEYPVMVVNGVTTKITDWGYDFEGDVALPVHAGDVFGLGAWSVDCIFGPSVAEYSQFQLVPSALSDLGDATIATYDGKVIDANFGSLLEAAGDLDGDGRSDLLVGEEIPPTFDPVVRSVHVMSMRVGGELGSLSDGLPGTAFGASIAALGDVDGDGVPDIAIGAPLDDTSAPNAGAVHVYSGRTRTLLWSKASLPFTDQRFGGSVASAGDVDGDGFVDVVAGAVGPFGSQTSHARVCSGPDGTTLLTVHSAPAGTNYGVTVAGIGDLDFDGHDDFVVGAPGHPSALGPQTGRVFVHSGANGQWVGSLDGLQGTEGFGMPLRRGPDLDGDGRDEVLATALGAWNGLAKGVARLVSPVTGAIVKSFVAPPSSSEVTGAHLARGTDVDGDGIGEFAIVSLIPGGTGGTARVYSGVDAHSIGQVSKPYDDPIASIALLDHNGDGRADLALADAQHTLGTSWGAGRVEIHSIACGDVSTIGFSCTASTGIAPTLDVGHCAARGTSSEIRVQHGTGGALCVLFAAVSQTLIPLPGGCFQYVPLTSTLVAADSLIGLGPGNGAHSWTVPLATTSPATFFVQALVQDSGAAMGFTATNAIRVDVN